MSKKFKLRATRKPNIKGASIKKQMEEVQSEVFNRKIKTGNKQITNGIQIDNKQITNREQTGNKKSILKSETGNKQVTKRVTKQITIGEQTGNKQVTKLHFETLVGYEKKLLLLIFKECLRIGNLVTPSLTLNFISQNLECTTGTAKTIIYRLIKKGFTQRFDSKTGRGGWIKFNLSKILYQDLRNREMDSKQITNREQTGNKQVTKRVTERVTNPSSSSSGEFLSTTTKRKNVDNSNAALQEVVIPENVKEIGFRKQHIIQILNKGFFSIEDLEASLEHFSYDLNLDKVKTFKGPLNFIMGVLVKQGTPYISESYMEQLRTEKKESKRLLEEYKSLKKSESEKLLNDKFEEYKNNINQTELDNLIPPDNLIKSGSPLQYILLKERFLKENSLNGK